MNHDLVKIHVENPVLLNLSLLLGLALLIIVTAKKADKIAPLSTLATAQMRGLAILIIVLHHLCVQVIENPSNLFIFKNSIVGLSIFLIISGFGIAISIENRGLDQFLSRRLIKIYLPFVLAMTLELLLSYLFLDEKKSLIKTIVSAIGLLPLDRNMWFIHFIIFYYCLAYGISKIQLSNKSKLIFLLLISIILIANPETPNAWKSHAFDFPLGYFIGLNSKQIICEIEKISKSAFLLSISLLSCLALAFLFFLASKNTYNFLAFLLISLLFIIVLINSRSRNRFQMPFEKIALFFSVVSTYFIYFNWSSGPIILSHTFYSFSSLFFGTSVILLISFVCQHQTYSKFLTFVGGISYEIYLLHGMFMCSFDFILFRGDISITFYLYFAFICLAGYFFKKLNDRISSFLIR